MKRGSALVGVVVFLPFVLCCCSKPAPTAGAFDWPMWRGPDGNGQSQETEWDPASIASPRILWTADVGLGYSDVVIQGGRLYAMGSKEGSLAVVCLDAGTGKEIWERSFVSYDAPQSTPAVAGEDLFVLTNEGYLYGIAARTGKQRWRKDLVKDYGAVTPAYRFAGSPIVAGDLVILTANSAGMAVVRSTGELAWTSDPPPSTFRSSDSQNSTGTGYSTPVLYDSGAGLRALLQGWNGLTAVDALTGHPIWLFGWDIEPAGSPVDPIVAGDKICVALAYEPPLHQSGFLIEDGGSGARLLWRTPEMYAFQGYPVVVDRAIFCPFGGPASAMALATSLRCLDLRTGAVMWDEQLGPSHPDKCFSLTAANGTLIVLDYRGTLYTAEASPDGFREIARCDVLQGAKKLRRYWVPPVICNARIYCRNFAGDLVCIDVSR